MTTTKAPSVPRIGVFLVAARQIATLQSQVAALQRQVQRTDDYVALVNLQSIYGYYVDKSRWDDAADDEQQLQLPG